MNMDKHFLIEFDYFDPNIKDNVDLQSRQNKIIDLFKSSDRIVSLSVSDDEAIMWIVMKANSESDLVFVMDTMEFPDNIDYDYFELNLHVSVNTFESYSLN
jgi:hypothetical protein